MVNFERTPKFEIKPIIEQKPFTSEAVKSFLKRWCEINDDIQIQVVSRKEWERKGKILEEKSRGRKRLFVPEDLQLWEMIGLIEAVDKDTFADKPERVTETKEKLLALGEP